MTRALLPLPSLGITERTLLESSMLTTRSIGFGAVQKVRMLDSLCSLVGQISGQWYISYHEDQEHPITVEGRGVHSLHSIAPWAIAAL
jgi:hypothetical protein